MLAGLVEGAYLDALEREKSLPLEEVRKRALAQRPVKPGATLAMSPGQHGIIAEIKRASPSKGALADIPDPVELAKMYEAGGASAISVLTESRQFRGSLADLEAVAAAVSIPVLRKDFVTTAYQVAEARAHGADVVLLIMACLTDELASTLLEEIHSYGMSALVETHSEDELHRALSIGARIVGVNARDLATFSLDKDLFGRLRPLIPEGVVAVAESAVANTSDVANYRDQGADLVLVGEALVTGANPQQTVAEFVAV
ncbi:MAG: indole-3-glycerol phosphate synthase TrpC [Pontimonas sp.]